MGRKKIDAKKKKVVFSLNIPSELYKKLKNLELKNKSKFFSWLLEEHFNLIDNKNA